MCYDVDVLLVQQYNYERTRVFLISTALFLGTPFKIAVRWIYVHTTAMVPEKITAG